MAGFASGVDYGMARNLAVRTVRERETLRRMTVLIRIMGAKLIDLLLYPGKALLCIGALSVERLDDRPDP